MKDCFDAMRSLRNAASKYGSPKSLRANILKKPDFLVTIERPENDAFAATAWTLELAHQNAFNLASVLRTIPISSIGEKPSDVISGIKSLFLDTDQIIDQMANTITQLDLLIKEYQLLETELEQAQSAMTTYTERSCVTRKSLDTEIGSLSNRIEQLERDRDAAYEKWRDLTISAVVVPAAIAIVGIASMVILSIPTGGNSFQVGSAITAALAAAAGTGLGVAAGLARTSYDNLVSEISTKNDSLVKRTAYRHDLGALDELMKFTLPSSSGIISQLQIIKSSWESSISEIRYKVSSLSPETLTDGAWLDEQEMTAITSKWLKVDSGLSSFVKGSFIDSNVIPFGRALPNDDPHWKKKLLALYAA